MSKDSKPNDGSGREPRDAQVDSFIGINNALLESDVVCKNSMPGEGKSYLLRSLQRVSDSADIITSDNGLIKQYLDDYPVLNSVIGKDHYATAEDYHEAHRRAKSGTPSIFNPLSYHFARQRGLRRPDRILIDEGHLFVDMLTYQAAQVISVAKTNVPENAKNEGDLIKWCYARYDRLKKAISVLDAPGILFQEFEKIARLKDSLEEGSQNQVFEISKAMIPVNGRRPQKCLVLTPVRVPHSLIKSVTDARKVIAVSGTMTRYDSEQIAAGRSLTYLQGEYLTPKENRLVVFDPVDPDFRKDPQALADKILEIYSANPVPTLVHCTYSLQLELSHLLGNLNPLVNNTKNKRQVKQRFMEFGGIWLAAGCAEGLDLAIKGSVQSACHQMIIPTMLYPDKADLFVQKRMGLHDGVHWYALRTYQNLIQRLGRGVRGMDDKCLSFILDPSFSRLHNQVGHEFPKLNLRWERQVE